MYNLNTSFLVYEKRLQIIYEISLTVHYDLHENGSFVNNVLLTSVLASLTPVSIYYSKTLYTYDTRTRE